MKQNVMSVLTGLYLLDMQNKIMFLYLEYLTFHLVAYTSLYS